MLLRKRGNRNWFLDVRFDPLGKVDPRNTQYDVAELFKVDFTGVVWVRDCNHVRQFFIRNLEQQANVIR